MADQQILVIINKSDVQIFTICGHTTRLSEIRLIRPYENLLESDMTDSPDFYISEIRGDRFTDFCVHTARFSGNRLKKVGRLEKNRAVGPRHIVLFQTNVLVSLSYFFVDITDGFFSDIPSSSSSGISVIMAHNKHYCTSIFSVFTIM